MKPPELWPPNNLARAVGMALWQTRVPDARFVHGNERDLQEWLFDELDEWGNKRLTVKCEPKGGGIMPIRVFGTSFWPDLALTSLDGSSLVAIEVKIVRSGSVPGPVSQALGQGLMYRQIYPQSLVVLATDLKETPPPPFFENVSDHDIEMTLVNLPSAQALSL